VHSLAHSRTGAVAAYALLTHCLRTYRVCIQGIRNVLEDSSGNGGASVSCYAAAGGIKVGVATRVTPLQLQPIRVGVRQAASVEILPRLAGWLAGWLAG
jgi:threonine synthase